MKPSDLETLYEYVYSTWSDVLRTQCTDEDNESYFRLGGNFFIPKILAYAKNQIDLTVILQN